MARVPLKAIPKAAAKKHGLLSLMGDGPLFIGKGDTDYFCAGCGAVLMQSIGFGQVQNVVIRHDSCSTYNLVPNVSH